MIEDLDGFAQWIENEMAAKRIGRITGNKVIAAIDMVENAIGLNEKKKDRYYIKIAITKAVFESLMAREPKDNKEFKNFVSICDQCISEDIDWDAIYELACDEFNEFGDNK
jgi:hypothetical protein